MVDFLALRHHTTPLIAHSASPCVDLTSEARVYAPGAYIFLKPRGYTPENSNSGHTFCRLTLKIEVQNGAENAKIALSLKESKEGRNDIHSYD